MFRRALAGPGRQVQHRGHIELVRQSLMNSGGNDNEDLWPRSLEGYDVRQPAAAAVWTKCRGCASLPELEALDLARRGLG